ncbi:hypothetical protein MMC18_000746 [Xylographa bjoerkii]|nr:hypothetical protein [Xylographa bjoerkii]
MPLSPYRSVVRNNFMSPADIGVSLQQLPYDHGNPTNTFVDGEDMLQIIRAGWGRPEARVFRGPVVRRARSATRSGRPFVRRDQPTNHPNTERQLERHHKHLLAAADPKTDLGRKSVNKARKTFQKASLSDPLKFSRGTEQARVTDLYCGLNPDKYARVINARKALSTEKALRYQPKAHSGDSHVQSTSIAASDPHPDTEQDACQGSGHKNDDSNIDPRLTSRPRPALRACTSDTRLLGDTDITEGVLQLTVNESHHGTGDEPRGLQIFGLYDQDIPGAESVFSSMYSAASGVPFAGVSLPDVPFNGYTDASESMFRTATSLTTVPSNGYTDANESMFQKASPFTMVPSNGYTAADESMFRRTSSLTMVPSNGYTDADESMLRDPFLNLSDDAANALLHSPNRSTQNESSEVYMRGNPPAGPRNTFIPPSTPASPTRLPYGRCAGTSNLTPLSGEYPHAPRTYANPYRPLRDWELININTKPTDQEDHFFPGFRDDQGPQVWFPKGPEHYKPQMIYKDDVRANYHWNSGFKKCDEIWRHAWVAAAHGIATGHPAFPARPALNMMGHLLPTTKRTTSTNQETTATGKQRSAVLEVQTPQRLSRFDPIVAERKEMGLPSRDIMVAANTLNSRTPAAGSCRPTETHRFPSTVVQGNRDIRRPRRLRPCDSATIGEPISIPKWIEEHVKTDKSAIQQLMGSLGDSEMPKIHNPAKKSKVPVVSLKLSSPKRQENQRATSIQSDHDVVEVRSTRRKARRAISIDSDEEYYVPRPTKRTRKSAKSLAVVQDRETTPAGSEEGSLADADGESESLTAYDTQSARRTSGGDNGYAT